MFNWVCSRCGHEVPPSKTECPFCTPTASEPSAQQPGQPQPPTQQYQPQQYQPQPFAPPPYQNPGPPPQYVPQQAPPPQYWPQQPQPPQYWQPPQQPYPPQQYPAQYQPPPGQDTPPPQQYQPPPQQYQPPPQQYQPPIPPPPPQEPPPQYSQPAPPPQYQQPVPERAAAPWPPAEERAGKPMWLVGTLAFLGVLAVFGLAYFFMGSHGSSTKDAAAKQQISNPLQKYVEVVGIRIVSEKGGQAAKFLVVNHSGVELADLTANVTLWASTARSEEDSIGSFTFHADSIPANGSKELSAPLKSEKAPSDIPDWRNITADVQVTSPQQ